MSEDRVWQKKGDLRYRRYANYDEYTCHQAEKLGRIRLEGYSQQFRESLRGRLAELTFLARGTTVLCLGARNGVECECFIELGCAAVGVDLNPGQGNRYVVTGDFHALQFADRSFDVVFTNSLDHAFDLDAVLSECRRVLKPNRGRLVTEIVRGNLDDGGRDAGLYESCWWENSRAVANRIVSFGFEEIACSEFTFPWVGDRFVFALQPIEAK